MWTDYALASAFNWKFNGVVTMPTAAYRKSRLIWRMIRWHGFGLRCCAANEKGVTYSRSATGTGMPSWNAFRHARLGRVFCAIHEFKITSFVADSSRSYAN
jgi:hypothetical protein